jgi:MYXO-CTERM domain-containing protein
MIPLLALLPGLMAADLTVGSSGDYSSIRDAIAAASVGDSITVDPGTYSETIWMGTGITVQARDGLGSVTIDASAASGNAVTIVAGTMRGMIIQGAPGQAVELKGGSAVLERSAVWAPGGVGVAVTANAPQIIEVAVYQAGGDAFSVTGGNPTIQRCLAVDPAGSGYTLGSQGSYDNLVAIGAQPGFSLEAEVALQHPASLDSGGAGLQASSSASVLNGLFMDNALVADCGGQALELAWSLLYQSPDSDDCPPAAVFHDNILGDPRLEAWSSGARPPLIDLRPKALSPMVDAGSGRDTDASPADMGPMGGEGGDWTDEDGDGVAIHFDCDDTDPAVNLHAVEIEDGKDNDCDGVTDEAAPTDTGETADSEPPEDTAPPEDTTDLDQDGWTVSDGDCEEHNSATWPGAPELPDGADNDCDGSVDEGLWYVDDDGDGYAEDQGDCDDGDASRSPAAKEQGEDGIDHDCDGVADGTASADADGDGWTVAAGDCDDTRPGVHPEAFDGIDGIDGDCDGITDDDGLSLDADSDGVTIQQLDCDDGDISISPTSPEQADDGIDQDCDGVDLYDVDGDGHPSPAAGGDDCDDSRPQDHPGADELCDGYDNDCDGKTDELCDEDSLDGPEREPWTPGIHAGCNCSAPPTPAQLAWPALTLLAGALVGRRRSTRA